MSLNVAYYLNEQYTGSYPKLEGKMHDLELENQLPKVLQMLISEFVVNYLR